MIEIEIATAAAGSVATVRVERAGRRTEHHVTVRDEDLSRYGATDPAELVRRAFEFLLARESNTSILREFRITEIERYFPGFAGEVQRRAYLGGDERSPLDERG